MPRVSNPVGAKDQAPSGGGLPAYPGAPAQRRTTEAVTPPVGRRPLPNCLEFFDLWFAYGILRAILVPVSPLSTPDELAWVLTDAACRVCVGDSVTAASLRRAQALSRATDVPLLTTADGPELTGRHLTRLARLPEPTEILTHPASEADIAAVLYTSGTTSRPKGVLITHANYVCVGEAVAGHLRIRPADRWLIVLPLFHANAQYYCAMSALMSGASLAVTARFSASGWSRQAWQLGATLASLFAAPVRMILTSPGQPHDRRNQLRGTLFAQNLTTAQARDFGRRFGTPLLQRPSRRPPVTLSTGSSEPTASAGRWPVLASGSSMNMTGTSRPALPGSC